MPDQGLVAALHHSSSLDFVHPEEERHQVA